MYFSRISINPLIKHQQLAQALCDDSYREHQALWRLFDTDPDARRDFLYRQTVEQGRVKYYVLSERVPVDSTGMWLIDPPKSYDPKLSAGQKLFFSLRANPVITVKSSNGKKQRHDVVMHEKKRIGFDKMPDREKPPDHSLIQQSCIKWLQSRSDMNGFSFEPELVTVEGYHQHISHAKDSKRAVKYSTVDFQGVLSVTDPDRFRKVLYNGIGKSKAFGCGLMLVRRI
jgi:CRISPR system Cascade subunit CasE